MPNQLSPIGRFERILLALDDSSSSDDAEKVALTMAKDWGASLVLTSVVITNPIAEGEAYKQIESAERAAHNLLGRVHGEAQALGVSAEKLILRGTDPVNEITQCAEEQHADVIVIGRNDKPGMLRKIMGPTSVKIIGAAKCSVLVVPAGADMWQHRILLATDGSRSSDAAGTAAAKVALMCKLPVSVVSSVRPSFAPERAAEARQAAVDMQASLAARGIEADHAVLDGEPNDQILAAAKERDADLIVIGTHGRTGWQRLVVGSVAESVISATTVPVLAVKL
jgi:nucleotide-binding universal stress UspA family protein